MHDKYGETQENNKLIAPKLFHKMVLGAFCLTSQPANYPVCLTTRPCHGRRSRG